MVNLRVISVLLFTILISTLSSGVYYVQLDYSPDNESEEFLDLVSGRFYQLPTTNPCINKDPSTSIILQTAFSVTYVLPAQNRAFLAIPDPTMTSLNQIFSIFDIKWPGCLDLLTGIGEQRPPLKYPFSFSITPQHIMSEQLTKIKNVEPACLQQCGSHASCLCEHQMQCPIITRYVDGLPLLPINVRTCISPYQCTGSGSTGVCFEGNFKDYSLTRLFLNRYETTTQDYLTTIMSSYISQCFLSPRFVFADATNSTVVIYGATSKEMRLSQSCSLSALEILAINFNFHIYSFDNELPYNIEKCAPPKTQIILPEYADTQPRIPGELSCGSTTTSAATQTHINCTAVKCPLWSKCFQHIDCIYGSCINNICTSPAITDKQKLELFKPRLNVLQTTNEIHSNFLHSTNILLFTILFFISILIS
jgi:hypothetical protein